VDVGAFEHKDEWIPFMQMHAYQAFASMDAVKFEHSMCYSFQGQIVNVRRKEVSNPYIFDVCHCFREQ